MAVYFHWHRLNRYIRNALLQLAVVAALGAVSFGARQREHIEANVMSLPTVTGPISIKGKSIPYLSVQNAQLVIDLARYGYVEEEYFLRGTANIYKWDPDYTVRVDQTNVPYATRIIVRRPIDPNRSNGTAIVEPLHPSGAIVWGLSHDYMLSKGITWVGITLVEQVSVLKRFDGERYTSLSTPPMVTCARTAAGVAQHGQDWDVISQVGMLLKTRPPNGVRVDHIYGTGLSITSGILIDYINFFHAGAKLPNGEPAYDGYLLTESGRWHLGVSACQSAPDEPHMVVQARGVPIIRLLSQTETTQVLAQRRADADTAEDKFRLYEVAGPSHVTEYWTLYLSGEKELAAVGSRGTRFEGRCAESSAFRWNNFPFQYFADGAFENLDQWSRQGTPPPPGVRLSVDTNTMWSPPVSNLNLDAHFNAVGGVRSPYVDVATRTYTSTSLGAGCADMMGYEIPLTDAQLRALYPTHSDYVSKVDSEVDQMVKDRWITEEDGRKIKDEAEHANVP